MDTAVPSFTILRVKRKLNPDEFASNANPDDHPDRFQSFKRLRHIGSFSSTTRPDEDTLVKNNLLKQLGLDTSIVTSGSAKKRVKISDLNSEQFQAVVERLEVETNTRKKKISKEEEEVDNDSQSNADPDNNNGIFNIKLTEEDLTVEDKENRNNQKETESITCNGHLLEVVDNSQKKKEDEEYVFDYYVYTQDLLLDDGFDVAPEGVQDVGDEDSNDENYRYNDYPDEDDFTDKEDDSDSERSDNYGDDDDEGVGDYGFRQFDDEEREYYDADDDEDEDFCAQFDRKMQLEKILKKNINDDSDDELDDDVDDDLMV